MRDRGDGNAIANFVLWGAVVLAATSYVAVNAASLESYGLDWGTDICSAVPFVCNNPHQVFYLAAGLGGLWILMKFMSALRD